MDPPHFRLPKARTSQNYEKEVNQLFIELEQYLPKVEVQKPTRIVTDCDEIFNDMGVEFQIHMDVKQVFLGGQHIPIKSVDRGNCVFIMDKDPRMELTCIKEDLTFNLDQLKELSFHSAKRLLFPHMLIITLTENGSSTILNKYLSLRPRLTEYKYSDMPESEQNVHNNTLILVLKEKTPLSSSPIGVIRVTNFIETTFSVTEADFFSVLNRMREKLDFLQPEIEVTIESCEHDRMEQLITVLKLVWLREKNRWGLRDKKHFLTVEPTMYVENVPEGICELTGAVHWFKAFARKRILPVSENAAKFDKRTRTPYSVVRCSANDYTPLLNSRHVNNLVYKFVENTELTHSNSTDLQVSEKTSSQSTHRNEDVQITYLKSDEFQSYDIDDENDFDEVYADAIIQSFPLDNDSIADVSTRTYTTV